MKQLLLLCFGILSPLFVLSQIIPDSTALEFPQLVATDTIRPNDSLLVQGRDTTFLPKKFKLFGASDYPNPTKALIFSGIIPGGGQIYNKDFWKLPFVYAGFGFTIYLVDFNSTQYLSLRRQYKRSLRDLPLDTTLPANTLKSLRDQADKNRQLSYIAVIGMYVFSAAEAFVDAHLASFDVDDDITFRLKPSLETTPHGGPVLGVGIRFSIE